jgi:uncharacterized protein (DUF2236 family)
VARQALRGEEQRTQGAQDLEAPARRRGLAVPAGPEDWGLFGPESISWRVHSRPVRLVGGLRALIIQSLNPLAMAGIDQHSDYREQPLSRLRRTIEYATTVVFGDTPSAYRAAETVERLNEQVKGVDPITEAPYSASDLQTKLWLHCVNAHSFLAAYRAYGGALSEADENRYLAEQVRAAELMGLPEELIPASLRGYRDFFEFMRPRLCVSESSRAAIDLTTKPPLSRELLPHQVTLRTMAAAAVAITPGHLRRMAGIERSGIVYFTAGAGARATGVLMRARMFDRMTSGLVGRRTVQLPRQASAAAKRLRS